MSWLSETIQRITSIWRTPTDLSEVRWEEFSARIGDLSGQGLSNEQHQEQEGSQWVSRGQERRDTNLTNYIPPVDWTSFELNARQAYADYEPPRPFSSVNAVMSAARGLTPEPGIIPEELQQLFRSMPDGPRVLIMHPSMFRKFVWYMSSYDRYRGLITERPLTVRLQESYMYEIMGVPVQIDEHMEEDRIVVVPEGNSGNITVMGRTLSTEIRGHTNSTSSVLARENFYAGLEEIYSMEYGITPQPLEELRMDTEISEELKNGCTA